jgi:hypothetical protein
MPSDRDAFRPAAPLTPVIETQTDLLGKKHRVVVNTEPGLAILDAYALALAPYIRSAYARADHTISKKDLAESYWTDICWREALALWRARPAIPPEPVPDKMPKGKLK